VPGNTRFTRNAPFSPNGKWKMENGKWKMSFLPFISRLITATIF
jgi:hypothetical protein